MTAEASPYDFQHRARDGGGEILLRQDGDVVGEITYTRSGDRMVIVHTGVRPEQEGRGLGKRLVDEAVRLAEREGLAVAATCWFARALLEKKRPR